MRNPGSITLGAYHGTVWINECLSLPATLRMQQERIDVSTEGPKLDRSWSTVDAAGHLHAMSGEQFPTLITESVHVECDGSCAGVCQGEGYRSIRYRCRLCNEVIEPGLIPGPHFDWMPGMKSWEVQAEGRTTEPLTGLDQVSVRFEAQTPRRVTLFGLAHPYDHTISSGMDGMSMSVRLVGASQLGERPAPPEAKAA